MYGKKNVKCIFFEKLTVKVNSKRKLLPKGRGFMILILHFMFTIVHELCHELKTIDVFIT